MNFFKLFYLFLIGLCLANCGSEKKTANSTFTFDDKKIKAQYHQEDQFEIHILNPNQKEIDSVVYYINEKKVAVKKDLNQFLVDLKDKKLGKQSLKAMVFYGSDYAEATTDIEIVSNIAPKPVEYKIINTYPHDITAYTQGLEFYRDTLYEGTGNGAGKTGKRGISSLRKTDYRTGKVFKKVELGENYFGEGITLLNNKVFQLTYKNNEAYMYNADTFAKEKTLQYPIPMEGWGLTTDGKVLYMTDSSEKIRLLDPETFAELDYINVYSLDSKVPAVNELEWIDGKIFGNVYQKDAIAIINPKTGAVEGIINLVALKKKVSQLPDTDVLNGIAYNPKTKTIFVTGKNWDKMFEIKVLY